MMMFANRRFATKADSLALEAREEALTRFCRASDVDGVALPGRVAKNGYLISRERREISR